MLDLRLPSGTFFAITGLILVVLGLTSNPQAPMSGTGNVDLYSGLVMLAFGIFLLALAKRSPQA
jgi:uncharacterized membrane protein